MEQNALEERVSENFHLDQETDEDRPVFFPSGEMTRPRQGIGNLYETP